MNKYVLFLDNGTVLAHIETPYSLQKGNKINYDGTHLLITNTLDEHIEVEHIINEQPDTSNIGNTVFISRKTDNIDNAALKPIDNVTLPAFYQGVQGVIDWLGDMSYELEQNNDIISKDVKLLYAWLSELQDKSE